MNKFWAYVRSILIPVIVGGIVGFLTSKFIDYETLQKPLLSPPGSLFPIMWTILYILMGISYAILNTNKLVSQKINVIYYLQLAVNALWSIIFFIFKWRLFAIIWIILLDILVIIMIKKFYKKNTWAGLLQIPYILWTSFATYLTIGIYILNG